VLADLFLTCQQAGWKFAMCRVTRTAKMTASVSPNEREGRLGSDAADTSARSTPPSHSGKFSRRGLTKYAAPAQGFRIAYDRMDSGKPVVLLHDWPGNRTGYNALAPMLSFLWPNTPYRS
jgi:hypothetical protein